MLQVPDKKKKSVNDDVPIFGASSSPSSSTPVIGTAEKGGDSDLPIFGGVGTNKKKDGSESYGIGSPSESVSDVESTEQIAPKSFIENDIENSQYSRDNAKQFTFESIGQPSPMIAPIGADVVAAKEKEKQTILSNSNELSKYSRSRIDALTGDIQNLKKQLSAHTLPSSTQMGIPSLTPTQFYTDGADSIKDEIAAKQKYLQQFKDNLLKLASHQVVKERNIPNPSQQDIESIGADVLQVTHDAGIGDDLEVLRTIGEVAAPRRVPSNISLGVPTSSPTNYTASAIPKSDIDLTTQNIKYKFYKTGAEALQQYYINQAEEFGDKAKDNIAALNEINQKLSKPLPANDRDALVAAQQAIMQDSDVKEYLNSLDNAIVYSKKSKDAVDNFPQVKRQQMQQTLNDVYFNMLLAKDAATSAIPNNFGFRVANWLFGDTAGEEDVKSLSKATGISEDQVRDIINQRAQGWFSGSDESGVRVPGFLPAIAQGMDETMGNAAMGIDRFFGAKNAEASNRILSDKLQSYNLRAQKAKLYDDAGKLNFNPYSLMNEMGRGIGQTAIYAAPSMVGAGLATGVAEGLGATVKNAENVGKVISGLLTVDSGFAASYEDAYKEAARYTNDESVRRAYAFKVGLANGLSETILEPAAVAKKVGLGKNTTKETFNTFLKNYKEGGAGKAVWEGLKEAGGVIRDENIEEILVNITQNKAKESDLGVDTSPSEFMDQSIQTIISTTLTTLPLGIGAGMNGARDQSGIRRNALFEAGNNPELYTGELKKKLDNGSLNQDQYNERVSVVNTMAAIVKNIKPTDIHGNKLSYDQKSKLAAQQFRILNNNRILESGAVVEAEKPIIEADNKEAIKNQSDILNATPTESSTEESVQEFDEGVPQSSKDALIEKIQAIDSRNAMVKQAQQNPEEGIAFIQDQATGMTSDRSSAAQPTYDETVKMFGEDVVNHAVSVLPQDTKDMILRSWKDKGIEAPAPLINALQSTGGEMQEQAKSEVATEEKEEESPKVTIAEIIDKPVTYNGKKATIVQDGQTLVAKINGENVEYELGNIDEIKGDDISDYGIEAEQSVVSTNDAGDIVVRGNTYKNNYSAPLSAINYDKDGNVQSVTLDTENGQKRTFRGNVAEDIAYQIQLKEISKDNESRQQFEDFVEQDDETKQQIVSGYDEAVAAQGAEGNNEEVSGEPATDAGTEQSKSESKPVERKKAEKKEPPAKKGTPLTKDAQDLLSSLGEGSAPAFVSKNLERIAKENGIEVTDKTTANDIVNQLREKQGEKAEGQKKQTPSKYAVNSEGKPTKNPSTAVEISDRKSPKEAAKAYRDSAERLREQGDIDGAEKLEKAADELEKNPTKKSSTKNKITTIEEAEEELKKLFNPSMDRLTSDERVDLLRNTDFIKTDETKEEDGEQLTKAYQPVYAVQWHYADNSNPHVEEFSDIDKAFEDMDEPGDYDVVDDYYKPYKDMRLYLKEVWIDNNNTVVEEGDTIYYEDFSYSNKNNSFVEEYGINDDSLDTVFFEKPEESAADLEQDVFFGINKEIEGERTVDGVTVNIQSDGNSKYRTISVEDKDGNEVGSIQLRISDHTYNPSRNTKGSDFISVEINNRDRGRYSSGRYSLRFTGDDTFEEVADAVNERIDEIISGWALDSLTKNNEEGEVSLINKNGKINYEQLERTSEGIESGKIIFERFSPKEQRGLTDGGRANVEASVILATKSSSDKSFANSNEAQENAIEEYAKNKSIWYDNPTEQITDKYGEPIGAGEEAIVWDDGAHVVKSQNDLMYGTLQEKLDGITLQNSLFPEAAVEVIGFGRNVDGDFQVIVRQPFIKAADIKVTAQEIRVALNEIGFTEDENGNYSNGDTIIEDVHTGNAVKTPSGNIVIIDPITRLNSTELGYGGHRIIKNNISNNIASDKISSIKVGDKSNTIQLYLDKAKSVLQQLYPGATITTYDTADEYYKQEKRPVGSAGVFHPKEQRLALNLELISKHGIENTVFHEVIHPIVNEAIVSREGALDSAWARLMELKDVPGMEAVFQHVQSYAGRGTNIQKVEGITEFLTQVADGRIDISKMPEKTSSKIIDLINKIFEALGISKRIGTPTDLKRLADSIKSSFESADASAIKDVIGRRGENNTASSFDALNQKEQEDAIKDIIARSENIDEEKLKDLIKKYTGWDDEKVNGFFPKEKPGVKTEERKFAKRVSEDSELSKEVTEKVKKNIEYIRSVNSLRAEEAAKILKEIGEDAAYDAVVNDRDIAPATRVILAQALIKRYNQLANESVDEKDKNDFYNKSASVAEYVADKLGTVPGQMIQALSLYSRLSPEAQIISAIRNKKKEAFAKKERVRSSVNDLADLIQEVNEEVANIISSSEKVFNSAKRKAKISAEEKIKKARQRREEIKKKYKSQKGTSLYSGVGLTKEGIEYVGNLAKTYIDEGIAELSIIIDRVLSDIKEVTKKDPNDEVIRNLEDIVSAHFYNVRDKEVYRGLRQMESEIGSAFSKYKFMPDETRDKIISDFMDKQNISDSEKQKLLPQVNEEFDKILERKQQPKSKTLSEKEEASVAKGLREMEAEIGKIIKKHYTVSEDQKKSLSQKFVDEVGLEKADADIFAKEVEEEFNRIATSKKMDILRKEKKRFDRIQKGLQGAKKVSNLADDIIKYTNLGAFGQKEFEDMIAEKLGTGALTPDQIAMISALAKKVENAPEGTPKTKATEDLLAFQADLKGTSYGEIAQAIWYANVLSGYSTHLKNIISTFFNGMGYVGAEAIRDPKSIPVLFMGGLRALKKGGVEAYHTFTTGETPIHVRAVDVPDVLERKNFIGGWLNPTNYLKFVTRAMKAEDVLQFRVLSELRATQMAYKEAKKMGSSNPFSASVWKKIDEKLMNTKARREEAEEQATQEGLSGSEKKRRVYELIEASRPIQMIEDAYGFAAKGTFNHDTEGSLGALNDTISRALDIPVGGVKPLRFLVPFTRILTNVVNNAIDFSPLGFIRAARNVRGFEKFKESPMVADKYHRMTEEERAQTIARASLATGIMAIFYVLSHIKGDDGEPILEVTGGGTGDYKKDAQLKQSGWQPYSIKIGNSYYSYALTPLAVSLGIVGNINDHEKYDKDATDEEIIDKISLSAYQTTKLMTDMTWISSAGGILSALDNPNPSAMGKEIGNQLKNTSKSFLVPNIYTQTAQEVNRIFNIPQKEIRGFKDQLIQDIPIARNSLNDKINALGDPVIKDTDIFSSEKTSDPAMGFLLKKKAWVAPINKNTLIVYDSKSEIERLATPDEYYDFSKSRGKIIKDAILSSMKTGVPVDYKGNPTISEDLIVKYIPSNEVSSAKYQQFLKLVSGRATKLAKMELNFSKPK